MKKKEKKFLIKNNLTRNEKNEVFSKQARDLYSCFHIDSCLYTDGL